MFRTIALAAAFIFPSGLSAAELVVKISEIRSAEGEVRAALYRGKDGFLEPNRQYAAKAVKSAPGELTLRFAGLPEGEYALALYHDENGNGELDSNLLGIPVEGIGFSADGRATFGPPAFKNVSLQIERGQVHQTTATIRY